MSDSSVMSASWVDMSDSSVMSASRVDMSWIGLNDWHVVLKNIIWNNLDISDDWIISGSGI